ncbi:uncharacterized protein LOC123914526 [Trifolium pratense]|uniref:uncharacterized protein LOC123914526 n=1 Tax=Trifolium pratense TaxID=57577 RepID=UPI001E698325|nr:uncharacterized protein LOC123914526 [Trifolium pratense]
MNPSPTCVQCGLPYETFLHCVRDCIFSRNLWFHLGFSNIDFFSIRDNHDWLNLDYLGPQAFTFRRARRHRNLMILKTWPLYRLSYNIQSMVEDFMSCFTPSVSVVAPIDRFVKCNNNNYRCIILNVDGSCLGSPVRATFGGLIRNSSGFIHGSSDIMLAKLYVIYHGLILAKDMAIEDLICYSDSLHCINLIKGSISKFHVHAVLIQDINKLLSHNNVSLYHTRETTYFLLICYTISSIHLFYI